MSITSHRRNIFMLLDGSQLCYENNHKTKRKVQGTENYEKKNEKVVS